MPQRDLRSNLKNIQIMNSNITSNTTTTSAILDTRDFDPGVMFLLRAALWTDGTYTPTINQSDDPAMADATAVTGLSLIGTIAGVTLSAAQVNNTDIPSIGIVNTKRYIQISVASTGVTSGARIIIDAINKPEVEPANPTAGG